MITPVDSIELPGLDGSNPLAFLSALGVLRSLALNVPEAHPRLAWTSHLHPTLHTDTPLSADGLVHTLHQSVRKVATGGPALLGDIIGVPVVDFRRFANPCMVHSPQRQDNACLLFASAYASDAVIDAKKGTVVPTAVSFSNGQGGKLLLKDFRTLAARLTPERLNAALFKSWRYADVDEPTFRWDPLDMRTGAHMASDPGSTETRSVMAANALAFVGLSFLATAPMSNELRTTCFRRLQGEQHFVWPLWKYPIGVDVVSSLLQQQDWPDTAGVLARFASRRIMFKKNLYLGGSVAI